MKTSQQLVLVTGAYSGIGLSIVNHLLKTTDYSVLMPVVPSPFDLEAFPRERLYGLNVDFSDEDAASLISTFVKQLPLALHGLVLNAGYISTSPSLMTARQLIIDHMEINFLNPLATTQLLVRKHLLKRRLGSVVYVSSSAAYESRSLATLHQKQLWIPRCV